MAISNVIKLITLDVYNHDITPETIKATAANIWSGAADYGKNEARKAKIDKELGKGYGQLVQDYINVLAGVRKSV